MPVPIDFRYRCGRWRGTCHFFDLPSAEVRGPRSGAGRERLMSASASTRSAKQGGSENPDPSPDRQGSVDSRPSWLSIACPASKLSPPCDHVRNGRHAAIRRDLLLSDEETLIGGGGVDCCRACPSNDDNRSPGRCGARLRGSPDTDLPASAACSWTEAAHVWREANTHHRSALSALGFRFRSARNRVSPCLGRRAWLRSARQAHVPSCWLLSSPVAV